MLDPLPNFSLQMGGMDHWKYLLVAIFLLCLDFLHMRQGPDAGVCGCVPWKAICTRDETAKEAAPAQYTQKSLPVFPDTIELETFF